jgi:Mg-chelatase subunit ChlD
VGEAPPSETKGCRESLAPGDALGMLAGAFGIAEESLDGWTVAENLSATSCEITDPALREYARRLATQCILRRAHELVGPIQPARRIVREPLVEPFRGELDEEESLENILGKQHPEPGDWITARREAKRTQVVLMMDTSLSMSGKNLALAAVAAAVLAFSIRSEDLSVVAFENTATALTHLGERDVTARVVEQILSQPARGFTNIEDALAVGRGELARGDNPRRAGLLITDGVYTAGGDPLREAALFPQLFVLLTEDYVMDEQLCARMARAGKGDLVRVKGYGDLPRTMLEVATRLMR